MSTMAVADVVFDGAAPAPQAPKRKRGKVRTIIGWLLIVAALGLAGFWAWQTFATTWLVRGEQQKELDQFETPSNTTIADVSTLCTDFVKCPPPVMDLTGLETGDAFGIITVPSWQGQKGVYDEDIRNRILVKEGSLTQWKATEVLNTGAAAHYPETAGPGEVGNFGVSAHRRSYGDNFLHLPDLVKGDWVLFEGKEAWYVYRVFDHVIVHPDDTHVIDPDPFHDPVCTKDPTTGEEKCEQQPTRRLITMTTCTDPSGSPWNNNRRWVVHGELYGWMSRKDGIPPMIDQYWKDQPTTKTDS
ncbi:MAG: sortase [Cellulomonadaceae bacterium]|nr:sortase [Cellulomonadaceae bacterium]